MLFHLHKGPSGSVTSLNDGALDPAAPGSGGGTTSYSYPQPNWTLGVVPVGPTGPDPARAVLTFTSKPLAKDIEIAGNGRLTLYASTTRDDMDFIVKLSEQFAQADDERREIAFRFANTRLQHLNGVAADNVHLRVELDAENTVAEIHQAGTSIPLDDAGTLFCAAQNLEIWGGGRERGGLPKATAAFQSLFDKWWERFPTFLYVVSGLSQTSQQIRTRFADCIEQPLNADRVDQLERPQLPAEAPPHDSIHIVGGMRDGRRDHGRIHKGRCEGVTQETAGLIRSSE